MRKGQSLEYCDKGRFGNKHLKAQTFLTTKPLVDDKL